MNILSVLIIEDDPNTCSSFIQHANSMDNIHIIDIVDDATIAINLIKFHHPDAIILDLELHLGGGTGLDILKALNTFSLPYRPYVLITTNNSSITTHNYARKLGADFILTKQQRGYSEKSALSFLQDMICDIKDFQHNNLQPDSSYHESNPLMHNYIQQCVMEELNLIGINPKFIGYKYLQDAITMTIKSSDVNFYKEIAQKYKRAENSIERAMRYAIDNAWKTSDIDDLLRHYTAKISSERGVPTVMEFISYYALKIKEKNY